MLNYFKRLGPFPWFNANAKGVAIKNQTLWLIKVTELPGTLWIYLLVPLYFCIFIWYWIIIYIIILWSVVENGPKIAKNLRTLVSCRFRIAEELFRIPCLPYLNKIRIIKRCGWTFPSSVTERVVINGKAISKLKRNGKLMKNKTW